VIEFLSERPAVSARRPKTGSIKRQLSNWRRFLPYLGGAAVLLIFAAALIVIHRYVQAFRAIEVRRALGRLQTWQPLAALGLTAASYSLLTLYDLLALRHIGRTLPYRRVVFASFIGYAFSHTLGFGSLIGPAVRYRIYTPLGLTAGEVAEASAFVVVTFITGIVAVFPLIVLLDPLSLGALGISRPASIAIGSFAALLIAGYVALGWWIERPLRLFGYSIHLARPPISIAQIVLSVADLSLVAAVLYACLPDASTVTYPHVLAVYVLAFVAGTISHVPGGLGVFDAVILVGLGARRPADEILAGLLAFRIIYQLIPVVAAGVLFAVLEATTARRLFSRVAGDIGIWVNEVSPTVLAVCAFTGGIVLLFSNAMPVSDARLGLVHTVLPLAVIEASHFIGSIDGVLLLLCAYGLEQRLRRAWEFAAVLLCVGIVSLMFKGFAWEEAVVLAFFLVVLLSARREFVRSSLPASQQYPSGWLFTNVVVLGAAFWLGLSSYKDLDAGEWGRFALYDNASRFLRASAAVSIVGLGAVARRLFGAMRGGHRAILRRVRDKTAE
jgi:phosphatidylglycerol lysyltransferase